MNYKEYQDLSSKTFAESNNETLDLLHCVIGASTEVGELMDAFKKHVYYKKELDIVNVGEEIADIQWYLFNLCRLLNLDMEKLLESNIEKLKARYGDKFSSEKAVNRNLETERKILENGVVIESRELSSGGMKPPKNNWTSYAKTVDVSDTEKNRLKYEMARKLGIVTEEKATKNNLSMSLSDVYEAFNFLENNEGSFIIKLITERKGVEDLSKSTNINLSEFKNRITKAETLALSFYDVMAMKNLGPSRFVALIDFDQITGVLKLDKIIGPSNLIISLSSSQQSEIDEYLNKNNIEK